MSEKLVRKEKTAGTTTLPPPQQLRLDPSVLYHYDSAQPELRVESSHYSNFAIVVTGGRDIMIDFLQVPGNPTEGRTIIPSTRIFLNHVNAQKLAEAIIAGLRKAHDDGNMEQYKPPA